MGVALVVLPKKLCSAALMYAGYRALEGALGITLSGSYPVGTLLANRHPRTATEDYTFCIACD